MSPPIPEQQRYAARAEGSPTEAPASTDPESVPVRREGGELLASISRRIVQLLARHAGKGPTKCKTHWAGPHMLVVVLGGGYTEAERTLYERGRSEDVRAYRTAIQDALSEDMASEVEALTGRKVAAFMSASHQEPDLLVEMFVLEPQGDGAGVTHMTTPSDRPTAA